VRIQNARVKNSSLLSYNDDGFMGGKMDLRGCL
jgi:hypothetical protein